MTNGTSRHTGEQRPGLVSRQPFDQGSWQAAVADAVLNDERYVRIFGSVLQLDGERVLLPGDVAEYRADAGHEPRATFRLDHLDVADPAQTLERADALLRQREIIADW